MKAVTQIAGADVRVRVTTTDGWNTAVAESGSFAVGGELSDGLVVAQDIYGHFWTVGLDGSGDKMIDESGGFGARWSPDGRRLVWRDDEIFIANADGSNKRQITRRRRPVPRPDLVP